MVRPLSPRSQASKATTPEGQAERWVFGYGSLMWRPGFAFAERSPALMRGRHRAFCIHSVHHRGTPELSGLVLGLAAGGSVRGVAYRIAEADWPQTYAYLVEREQPTETYVEARVALTLADGRAVRALSFLSDRNHPQWAGALSPAEQAERIARATGLSGRNIDYLRDLVDHLRQAGWCDRGMEALLQAVERLEVRSGPA